MPSHPAQERHSPDRQPFSDENVAIVEKDGIMRRDELSRGKLRARLAAARPHLAVLRLPVSQLRNHVEFLIENTHLAIQIGAYHPLTLRVEIAGHSQVCFVLDRPQMSAVKCERLNPAVSAVGYDQQGLLSPWVHPLSMRVVHL